MARIASYGTPRADLGAAFQEYMVAADEFIGTRAMPLLDVTQQSGTFSKITREAQLVDRDVNYSAKSGYNRMDYEAEDGTYSCVPRGLEILVTDIERSRYANDWDVEAQAVKSVGEAVLRMQEKRIATALFNTTTWTGASLYTDYSATPWATSSTDVMTQILAAKEKVRALVGKEADTLICSQTNFNYLKNNDDFLARVAYTARASDAEMSRGLADLLGLRQILVGKGVRNSADEGQTFTSANLWSNTYAMLMVVAEGPTFASPGVGRCPLWRDDSPSNMAIIQYRDEARRGDVFRAQHNVGETVIDASYAHLIKVA